jgi:hypothetical protein
MTASALGVWAAYDRQAARYKFWLIVGDVFLFYFIINREESLEATTSGANLPGGNLARLGWMDHGDTFYCNSSL